MVALFNPLTLVLASLCVEWFVVAEAGPFTIKLPYLALFLLTAYAATSFRRISACLLFARQNAAWIVPFILYLLLLGAALYGSPGQNTVPRQFVYLVGCVAFGGCLAAAHDIKPIFRVGAGVAVALFIGVVEITARKLGLSWFDAIRQFVGSGDLHYVVYTFLNTVFNSTDPSGDVNIVTSEKNAIAVCILVVGLIFRSASSKPSRDLLGMIHMSVVFVLLVMLNTRSVIIAAGMGVLLAIGLRLVARPGSGAALLGLKALCAVLAIVLVIEFSDSTPVTDLMSDRFAFEDTSAAARLEQYSVAIDRIEHHPWTGSGFYEVGGYPVHNLFLSSWMNAGIAALFTVLCFYLVLIARWLSFLWMLVKRPERWVLPLAPEWIATLPICPLFRVWISGGGGNLFLGEWMALAAFLGIMLANDLKRRSADPARREPVPPRYRAPRPMSARMARQRIASGATPAE